MSNRRVRIITGVITVVLIAMVAGIVCLVQGSIVGYEFAPSHFQTRRFEFYELPLFHRQLTPIRRSNQTSQVARFLRQKNYLRVPQGLPTVWHPVSLRRGSGDSPDDAQLLTQLLEMGDSGTPFWKQWSLDHPAAAAVLWPRIQFLASQQLYVFVPALMQIAIETTDPILLKQRMDAQLIDEYRGLIADLRAAGDQDVAIEIADEASAEFPSETF